MPELRVESVDPRDQGWELWEPTYRVYFWRRFDGGGWASRELQISGGDVVSTLASASEHSSEAETYQVFCVVPAADGIGLVRLTGDDPTRAHLPLGPHDA